MAAVDLVFEVVLARIQRAMANQTHSIGLDHVVASWLKEHRPAAGNCLNGVDFELPLEEFAGHHAYDNFVDWNGFPIAPMHLLTSLVWAMGVCIYVKGSAVPCDG